MFSSKVHCISNENAEYHLKFYHELYLVCIKIFEEQFIYHYHETCFLYVFLVTYHSKGLVFLYDRTGKN